MGEYEVSSKRELARRAQYKPTPTEKTVIWHFDSEFTLCGCATHRYFVDCTSVAKVAPEDPWCRCLHCNRRWRLESD